MILSCQLHCAVESLVYYWVQNTTAQIQTIPFYEVLLIFCFPSFAIYPKLNLHLISFLCKTSSIRSNCVFWANAEVRVFKKEELTRKIWSLLKSTTNKLLERTALTMHRSTWVITAAEESLILKCLPLTGPEILSKLMCCLQLWHRSHSTALALHASWYVI